MTNYTFKIHFKDSLKRSEQIVVQNSAVRFRAQVFPVQFLQNVTVRMTDRRVRIKFDGRFIIDKEEK